MWYYLLLQLSWCSYCGIGDCFWSFTPWNPLSAAQTGSHLIGCGSSSCMNGLGWTEAIYSHPQPQENRQQPVQVSIVTHGWHVRPGHRLINSSWPQVICLYIDWTGWVAGCNAEYTVNETGNFHSCRIHVCYTRNIIFSVTILKFQFMSELLITINEKCQSVLSQFSWMKNLLNFQVHIIVTCKLVVP